MTASSDAAKAVLALLESKDLEGAKKELAKNLPELMQNLLASEAGTDDLRAVVNAYDEAGYTHFSWPHLVLI